MTPSFYKQLSESARDVYDRWHDRLEVDAESSAPWHLLIKSRIDPIRDIDGKRILEIGCGRGGFSFWLATRTPSPAQVVGADFSSKAVNKARQFAENRGVSNISWSVADIQALNQFGGGEFDTVVSCETIEHVPDPPLAVKQLARVLKPGGRLFLTTPNYFSTTGVYRAYCWVRGKKYDECGQPICQLTMLHKTRRWVRRAGLRIVESDSRGQYIPFPRRPPIEARFLEHPRFLMRWFGLHSFVLAEKPVG